MKSSELKYPDGDKSQSFRHGLDWDKDQFALCLNKLKSFRNCIDLGGHIGITTIRFAQHFKHVYAFEPVHGKYFKHNTKHLKNVTLYEYAVSDYNGNVDMFINVNNSGGCAPADQNTHPPFGSVHNSLILFIALSTPLSVFKAL